MASEVHCKQHPNARAGWSCPNCRAALCLRCAYRRRAGHGWLIVCAECGGMANPIMIARSGQSFLSLVPSALLYPFSQAGLITMVAIGIVLALLTRGGTAPSAIALGSVVSYL